MLKDLSKNRERKSLEMIEKSNIKNYSSELMPVESIEYSEISKCYTIRFKFENTLRGREFFYVLWNSMNNLVIWDYYTEKQFNVAVTTTNRIEKRRNIYALHRFARINTETTFIEYFNQIWNTSKLFWEAYNTESDRFDIVQVTFYGTSVPLGNQLEERGIQTNNIKWKGRIQTKPLISKRSYSTDNFKVNHYIKPLQIKNLSNLTIVAIDIETVEYNNMEYPILISLAYMVEDKPRYLTVEVDPVIFEQDTDFAIFLMWKNFFDQMKKLKLHKKKVVIFAHNLGSFDGYFILSGLLKYDSNTESYKTMIDDQNKIIGIEYNYNSIKWLFRDSCRIFPMSLAKLTKLFITNSQPENVKSIKYNKKWNNIDIFNDEKELSNLIYYNQIDSSSLLIAMINAREHYYNKLNVDICKSVSNSSLSMLIYRTNFQDTDIPILPNRLDRIIRNSYYGGSTDFYHHEGDNLFWYDVNSLYPYSMLKPMPLKFIGQFKETDLKWDKIFGFVECIVKSPKNIDIPLLPVKTEDSTIHPVGVWEGMYFSEELKAVMKYGYEIEVKNIYQFSKELGLFNKFIQYFYKLKLKSLKGSVDYSISKLIMNGQYGNFGRKPDMLNTIISNPSNTVNILCNNIVKNIINVNNDVSLFLTMSTSDPSITKHLHDINYNINTNSFSRVKSNVAIASAITSYARIHMMQFKTLKNNKVFYTDTDSVFLQHPLPDFELGPELGKMKNELPENKIVKAYFYDKKKYVLKLDDGKIISKISGVEANSINDEDLQFLNKNKYLLVDVELQFHKDISELTVRKTSKTMKIVSESKVKKLINNKFQNIEIENIPLNANFILKKILNRFLKFIKKINTKLTPPTQLTNHNSQITTHKSPHSSNLMVKWLVCLPINISSILIYCI